MRGSVILWLSGSTPQVIFLVGDGLLETLSCHYFGEIYFRTHLTINTIFRLQVRWRCVPWHRVGRRLPDLHQAAQHPRQPPQRHLGPCQGHVGRSQCWTLDHVVTNPHFTLSCDLFENIFIQLVSDLLLVQWFYQLIFLVLIPNIPN